METRLDEIGDGIFRMSTLVPEINFTFNQFIIDAEEPLLFHCGMRGLFPQLSEALGRVMPLERLRWISFGHVEADELGAMNHWLAAAPHAQVVHSDLGCAVSINDLADRPPRALGSGERLELGGRRVRLLETPHVPHNWEAIMLFEEVTGTLLCGDLGSNAINDRPVAEDTIVDEAIALDEAFPGGTVVTPSTPQIINGLAALEPSALAIMHGASFTGKAAAVLRDLASAYERRLASFS